jgi:energy-coupling factor transporter transmembrane protein EcfT
MARGVSRHPVAWMMWAAGAALPALLTRNPAYLALIGAAALLVQVRVRRRLPARSWLGVLAGLLLFPAALNLLLSRVGETVLLRLPIPWIGGPYTLEALLFGASAGVQIASLLQVMAVFGDVIQPSDLLRRMPPGLHPAGVAASIGLTFAPQVRRSFAAIREASELRGHRPRGWRDVPSIVSPLVVLSLENAMAVAEGMVVRGWGQSPPKGLRRWGAAAGWLALASGLALGAIAPRQAALAAVLVVLGVAATWLSMRTAAGRNRYRPEVWSRGDTFVAGLSLGVLVLFLLVSIVAPGLLTYYPYPRAAWPSFHPTMAAAIMLLTSPLWLDHGDR